MTTPQCIVFIMFILEDEHLHGPRVISALRPPPLRPLQKVGKSIVRPQWADLTISDQSENLLSDPYSEECVKNGADGILENYACIAC